MKLKTLDEAQQPQCASGSSRRGTCAVGNEPGRPATSSKVPRSLGGDAGAWGLPCLKSRSRPSPTPLDPQDIVIFGATGSLARLKLFPALYDLTADNQMPPDGKIIGLARRSMGIDAYRGARSPVRAALLPQRVRRGRLEQARRASRLHPLSTARASRTSRQPSPSPSASFTWRYRRLPSATSCGRSAPTASSKVRAC